MNQDVAVGGRVWMGRLNGVGSRCLRCDVVFVTSPVEPTGICLRCEQKARIERVLAEYPVLRRLVGP